MEHWDENQWSAPTDEVQSFNRNLQHIAGGCREPEEDRGEPEEVMNEEVIVKTMGKDREFEVDAEKNCRCNVENKQCFYEVPLRQIASNAHFCSILGQTLLLFKKN